MGGDRHTDTGVERTEVGAVASMIVHPVNRARMIDLHIPLLAPPVWYGGGSRMIPLNGHLINRLKGNKVVLGPDQALWAVTVGPDPSVVLLDIEDRIDEGLYTDDGSGVLGDEVGGGRLAAMPPASPPPSGGRQARG